MKENRYPHVFQPLTVRGLTLKNRLQYAPTVVLKCTPDGQVGQEMLDFMKWQASTGVAYITVGDTPVTHDDNSAWLCEMNVNCAPWTARTWTICGTASWTVPCAARRRASG